jgi:hypothetical protein
MGIETDDFTIGEDTYRVSQLGAKRGRKALVRLVKAAGPVLGAAAAHAGDLGEIKGLGDIKVELIGRAISEFTNQLSEADVDHFCDLFAPLTLVKVPDTDDDWVPLDKSFDQHFAGRYGQMLEWLWTCIRFNFLGFTSALGSGKAERMLETMMAAFKSTSPRTSTSSSGDPSPKASAH